MGCDPIVISLFNKNKGIEFFYNHINVVSFPRSDPSALPVSVPELPELADDHEEHLLGGDVEEQGHEVPVLQYY